jgi:D-alanine-D-alanine ligase
MKRRDVLVLFNVVEPTPPDYDFTENFKQEDFETERDVVEALRKLRFKPQTHPINQDLHPLVERLTNQPPSVLFNLCDYFRMDRRHEPHVMGVVDMLGVPHTGASSTVLAICKDKALTKKILTYHHIKTPKFVYASRRRPIPSLSNLKYPVFVKPVATESSEGISQAALAETPQTALERVKFIHQSVPSDALVEEYVVGREIHVGVIGNDRLVVLPPVELLVADLPMHSPDAPKGAPQFFTFRAKWNEAYRKKWGIRSAAPENLPDAVSQKLKDIARRACRALNVRGYARVDARVTPEGEVHVIEVNPNPGLSRTDEFALAWGLTKRKYEELILRITKLAGPR